MAPLPVALQYDWSTDLVCVHTISIHLHVLQMDGKVAGYYVEFLPRVGAVRAVLAADKSCSVQVHERKIIIRSGERWRAACDWTTWSELESLRLDNVTSAKHVAGEGLHVRLKLAASSCERRCTLNTANGDIGQSLPLKNRVSCTTCLAGLVKEQ